MQTAFQPLFLRPLHSPRMEVIAMKADIKEWDPEDPKKWDKRLAWTTVWIYLLVDLRLLRLVPRALTGTASQRRRFPP